MHIQAVVAQVEGEFGQCQEADGVVGEQLRPNLVAVLGRPEVPKVDLLSVVAEPQVVVNCYGDLVEDI